MRGHGGPVGHGPFVLNRLQGETMSHSDIELSNAMLEEQEAYEVRRGAQTAWCHNPSQDTREALDEAEELLRDAQSKLSVLNSTEVPF